MFIPTYFLQYAQWSGIVTVVFAIFTLLTFILKLHLRFRLVGTTGFMLVLTAGLFALSLTPLTHTVIPGAVKYSLIYDNGSTQTVISIPNHITPSELDATLRQAAINLYSVGRSSLSGEPKLTIRARTIVHPNPGLSIPLYLGQIKQSLTSRDGNDTSVEIYKDKFDKLPNSKTI